MKAHEALHGPVPAVPPAPIVALVTLLYIPIAFTVCSYVVREASYEDFLGFDIGRAVTRSHLPASALALALSIWSLRRHERHLWLGYLLLTFSCLWLACSAALGK